MALDSKNNIKSVFIVPDIAATTVAKMLPGASALGSISVTNMSNEVLAVGGGATGVQSYSKIKIIKDRGADLPLQQVVLDINDIIAYTGVAGVAGGKKNKK